VTRIEVVVPQGVDGGSSITVAAALGDGRRTTALAQLPPEAKAGDVIFVEVPAEEQMTEREMMVSVVSSKVLDDDDEEAVVDRARRIMRSAPVRAGLRLHGVAPIDVDKCVELFHSVDCDGDGAATTRSLNEAFSAKRGLVDETAVSIFSKVHAERDLRKLLRRFDSDGDGRISSREWAAMILALVIDLERYLRRRGLAEGRLFFAWGFASDEDGLDFRPPKTPRWLQALCADLLGCPAGWLDDLVYHVRNNHPLLCLCLADPDHPIRRRRLCVAEFVVQCWALSMAAVLEDSSLSDTSATYYVVIFALVTAPTFVFQKIIRYLYAAPCLMVRHDLGHTHYGQLCYRRCFLNAVDGVVVSVGLVAAIFGLVLGAHHGGSFMFWWFFSLASDYVLVVFWATAISFNECTCCLASIARAPAALRCLLSCGLNYVVSDAIQFAGWEKTRTAFLAADDDDDDEATQP